MTYGDYYRNALAGSGPQGFTRHGRRHSLSLGHRRSTSDDRLWQHRDDLAMPHYNNRQSQYIQPTRQALAAPSAPVLPVTNIHQNFNQPMTSPPLTVSPPLIQRHSSGPYQHNRRHSVAFDLANNGSRSNPGAPQIRFKRKNALHPGISFSEALDGRGTSESDHYSYRKIHTDTHDCIMLRVQWCHYREWNYKIPVSDKHGKVSVRSLARRISRACVNYLQEHMIPVDLDTLELHHIEEISYGYWQPMLLNRP